MKTNQTYILPPKLAWSLFQLFKAYKSNKWIFEVNWFNFLLRLEMDIVTSFEKKSNIPQTCNNLFTIFGKFGI